MNRMYADRPKNHFQSNHYSLDFGKIIPIYSSEFKMNPYNHHFQSPLYMLMPLGSIDILILQLINFRFTNLEIQITY